MIVNLQATFYESKTKGDVKRMRKEGKLPAILYGHKEKSKKICVQQSEFRKVLDILREKAVTVNLKVNDKSYLCVIKAIQHNPVTDELLHIDFQHIHRAEKIKATIPIHVVGTAPGIEKGGILDQHLHEAVVRCLPADMPSHIDVDVSNLDLGQTIHLYDIALPNVDFELSKESTVVSVLIPRAVAVEVKPEVEEGVVAEEAKEGEEAKEEVKEEEVEGKETREEKGKRDRKGKESEESKKR